VTSRTIVTLVKDGVSYLADLIARIVSGIRDIAPLALVLSGCQAGSVDAAIPPAPPAREAASVVKLVPTEQEGPTPIGAFNITFYYVAEEDVVAKAAAVKVAKVAKAAKAAKAANDNHAEDGGGETELAAVSPPELVTLYSGTDGCEPIAEVSREFAAQLALQGTGKLKDGRVLNVWGHCSCDHTPCFKVTDTQWGTAGAGKPLQPFRTVAVDPRVIKLGTLLYVPLLEGRTMPGRAPWGGFIHDGCVVADDTGGGIDGNQLDLFVGRKAYFLGISGSGGSHAWARHVPVFDGAKICERKGRKITKKAGAI
jgi:3D (Asp-Asp-Asp) domain-containing protein